MANPGYYTFNQVGPDISKEQDPWWYCITNNNMFYSDFADRYGGTNDHCRRYMAQRCSQKWDKPCEIYSWDNNKTVPDESLADDLYDPKAQDFPEGHKHVLRTFAAKYCRKVQNPLNPGKCVDMQEDFNPIVVGTPKLEWIAGDCQYICDNFEQNQLDPLDPIIEKIVQDDSLSKAAANTFIGLCKNAKENNVKLVGHLKDICDEFNGDVQALPPDANPVAKAKSEWKQHDDMYLDLITKRKKIEGYSEVDAPSAKKKPQRTMTWVLIALTVVLLVVFAWCCFRNK